MRFIMFTKHLKEYDLPRLVSALKSAGMDGADLWFIRGLFYELGGK